MPSPKTKIYYIKESADCYVRKAIFIKLANFGLGFFKMAANMASNLLEMFEIRVVNIKNIDIKVLHFQKWRPSCYPILLKYEQIHLTSSKIRLVVIKSIDMEVLHVQINWLISFIDYFSEMDFENGGQSFWNVTKCICHCRKRGLRGITLKNRLTDKQVKLFLLKW